MVAEDTEADEAVPKVRLPILGQTEAVADAERPQIPGAAEPRLPAQNALVGGFQPHFSLSGCHRMLDHLIV